MKCKILGCLAEINQGQWERHDGMCNRHWELSQKPLFKEIPIVQEGLTEDYNLVTCCRECNVGKSDTMFCENLLLEVRNRIFNEDSNVKS